MSLSDASPGERLRISEAVRRELIAHAVDDLPNECCGMLAGTGDEATVGYRAANTESSPFMYVMSPQEQLRLMEEIDASGLELLAIYHSHTRSAAYPSRTDVELAFYPSLAYLIVSLADPDDPEIRAFRIRRDADPGEAISELAVEIG